MKSKPFSFASIIFVSCILAGALLPSVATADNSTKVENSKQLPATRGMLTKGMLTTVGYAATEMEKSSFAKLMPDETITSDYSIHNKTGGYVGWFGIVRKIEEDITKAVTTLLIEMKYFDGLTDGHIMTVSCYGNGDFKVLANGIGLGLKPLSLVKVYGTVKGQNDLPEVQADYIRQWDWGLFNFMNYGTDNTNSAWKELNKIKDPKKIYTPYPDQKYYEERLGIR